MGEVGKARRLGWLALGFLGLAVALIAVPEGTSRGYALAGAVALHPAVFAAIGAVVTYRDLSDEDRSDARVALVAFPAILLGALWLWLTW